MPSAKSAEGEDTESTDYTEMAGLRRLVFVTTFMDRKTVPSYFAEIAWGTEVWVSEAPDHLIHFNGDRFLGPHEG